MDGILPEKIRDRKDKAEFSELIIQQNIVKLGLIKQLNILYSFGQLLIWNIGIDITLKKKIEAK